MTGKQLWDEIEALEQAKHDLIAKVSDEELRRALGYGMNRAETTEVTRHRAMLRRTLRRRGVRIPDSLIHVRLSAL